MTNAPTDVIIANPIYDVVFKNLMTTENDTGRENARYFLGTILGEEIVEIDLLPQEYTYHAKPKIKQGKKKGKEKPESMSYIRMDFVATIRTKSGEDKRVMIELQKCREPENIVRFRTYLGEQYKQTDKERINKEIEIEPIPVVFIYILGFNLTAYNTIVMKVDKSYIDLINNDEMKIVGEDPYIELLNHDSYYIQVARINGEMYKDWDKCNELKQLLSLFEQDYFVEANYIKKYPYPITNKNIKKMVETLKYIAADPKMRRIMQEEYWAAEEYAMWEKQVAENEALSNQLAAKDNQLAKQSNQLAAKDNEIAKQEREIAELRRRLGLSQ